VNKKIIIYCIAMAMINYVSCTSLSIVTNNSIKEEIDNNSYRNKELEVQTQDGNRYNFDPWSYQFENDTLYGEGTLIISSSEESFEGKIPVVEIVSYKYEQFDILKTSGLVLAVAGVIILGFALIVGSSVAHGIENFH
jgi:hypothetical protein